LAGGFVHYEARYQVLICKEHGYTLQGLSTHLRDQHYMPAKARKATVKKYRSYKLVDPKGIPLPPLFEPPFEALAAPTEAFMYKKEECSVIKQESQRCGAALQPSAWAAFDQERARALDKCQNADILCQQWLSAILHCARSRRARHPAGSCPGPRGIRSNDAQGMGEGQRGP